MTEVIAAVASVTGLGALAAVITLAIMLARSKDAVVARADAQLAAERTADAYLARANAADVQVATLTAENATLRGRLTADDRQRNDLAQKETDAVRSSIAAAADPADALNRMLSGADVPARTAHPAAGGDSGQAAAVPAAGDAGSGGTGGHDAG